MKRTHQKDFSKPKNMVISHSRGLVWFVEKQCYTTHNQQYTQVLSEWVFLPQYRHTEDHNCNNTKQLSGLEMSDTSGI